uniref:Reverse transcriptase domain-containing protein n=1 Tax=Tanacetum cinerariifolium TaxID=118510 RepID=A0A699J154_TANCI|nr:hypothetical protein [Tanacetum cinerariifolium]
MGDDHLSTILETGSDEVIKSSVENLVPIPSESEVTFNNESECDVPVCDDFTTISNPLFDCNDDFTSSDDKSLSNEDIPIENFKIHSNSLFDNEIISSKIDPHHVNTESDLIESLLNQDTLIVSSSKFDFLLEEFSPLNAEIVDMIVESHSPFPIPVEDSDSQIKEIDLFLATDDLMPWSIKNEDYDSEGDIHFLEDFLSDDHFPLPKNESSNFDHHDDTPFLRPPPEPPDVEVFFDFEPDTGVLIVKVVEDISEHYVLMPNILPTLPTLLLNFDTLLPFSSENEDKVFKPRILSYLLVSHWDKIMTGFSENPMMMYGGDIPLLDVPIAPDLKSSHARGFVHRPLELQSFAYGNSISEILLI